MCSEGGSDEKKQEESMNQDFAEAPLYLVSEAALQDLVGQVASLFLSGTVSAVL